MITTVTKAPDHWICSQCRREVSQETVTIEKSDTKMGGKIDLVLCEECLPSLRSRVEPPPPF